MSDNQDGHIPFADGATPTAPTGGGRAVAPPAAGDGKLGASDALPPGGAAVPGGRWADDTAAMAAHGGHRVDQPRIRKAVREILIGIGEDPEREGLRETPDRVARAYEELAGGVGQDPADQLSAVFDVGHDEMVIVRNIPFYSMCEHHLLPFMGSADIAYIPSGGKVTGLSKLARVVDVAARRPQVQERLTTQVADAIMNRLQARGVLVVVDAEHLCMTMRGVQKPGSRTVTSAVRGVFQREASTRQEAFALLRGQGGSYCGGGR